MLETELDQKKWEKRFTDDGIEIGIEKGQKQKQNRHAVRCWNLDCL